MQYSIYHVEHQHNLHKRVITVKESVEYSLLIQFHLLDLLQRLQLWKLNFILEEIQSRPLGRIDRKWRHFSIPDAGFLSIFNTYKLSILNHSEVIGDFWLVNNGGKSISATRWHHGAISMSSDDLLTTLSA
jgi:hypothetical protein